MKTIFLIIPLLLFPFLANANFLTFTDTLGVQAKPRHIYFDSVTTFYYSLYSVCTAGDSCFVQIDVYGKENGVKVGASTKGFFMAGRLNDPSVKPLWMTFRREDFRNDNWSAKKDSNYLIQISVTSKTVGFAGSVTDTISTYPDKKPPSVNTRKIQRKIYEWKKLMPDLLGRVK